MTQKDIFLASEGDAWFDRNQSALGLSQNVWHGRIIDLANSLKSTELLPTTTRPRVLEVGCANGALMQLLEEQAEVNCWGIEPSGAAVSEAKKNGLNVVRGTADYLPFPDEAFDVVIYGFCLYLCDLEDHQRIVAECERVLAPNGLVLILDFFADRQHSNPYHHCAGVQCHKMDWASLFQRDSQFVCLHHTVGDHHSGQFTVAREEWVGLTLLAKLQS